ncbi:hypothetical protein BJ878DRAFT_413495 [Calycina marina]|uniref:Uncharacterized protein n=1 Tax=Calycina marina TaxID=1763456 RepID=A0A9P7ZA14_9HELO|nr:hypothetical protein BJ878DRAFT_413495 [Calycina marina]
MGQAFSGPDAFEFLGFTPKATAVLQANPIYLFILLVVILGCVGIGLICYTTHLITNKPYYKPKPKKEVKGAAKK